MKTVVSFLIACLTLVILGGIAALVYLTGNPMNQEIFRLTSMFLLLIEGATIFGIILLISDLIRRYPSAFHD